MALKDEQTVVGGRLVVARKLCGLSQKGLAVAADMEQSQVSGQETGKYRVQIDLLLVLIQKYNVNINWLLTGEGAKFLPKAGEGSHLLHEPDEIYGGGVIERMMKRISDLEDWRSEIEKSE